MIERESRTRKENSARSKGSFRVARGKTAARPKEPEPKTRWLRRKEARPQEILEAALFLFAHKGFAATRMEEIAQRANVSKGTIYLYFESKEAVFKALLHQMLAARFSELAGLARDRKGPVGPIIASVLRNLGAFVSTSDLVVLPKIVIAEAGNFPDLARIYREEVAARGMGLFGALLKAGMAEGEFRKVPVEHAVRLCVAPILLAAIWRTTFAQLDPEPYDYRALIELHIQTLLRGLAADGGAR